MVLTDQDFEQAGDRHQAVVLAVGAASMCWEHPEGAGVFASERAIDVANDLIRYLQLTP
jgi:hypothetical protein